jgi:hypothetical protein
MSLCSTELNQRFRDLPVERVEHNFSWVALASVGRENSGNQGPGSDIFPAFFFSEQNGLQKFHTSSIFSTPLNAKSSWPSHPSFSWQTDMPIADNDTLTRYISPSLLAKLFGCPITIPQAAKPLPIYSPRPHMIGSRFSNAVITRFTKAVNPTA